MAYGLTGLTQFMSGAGSDKDIWGSKPKVPVLGESQQTSIAANTAALPALQNLGGEINTFNQDQLLGMLRKSIPGYDDIMKKSSENIQAGLRGEIPQDVADQIKRNSAVKGVYNFGTTGGTRSGNTITDYDLGRHLGLTSYEITNRAQTSSERWMQVGKALAVPGQFDVTSMFVSPAQQFERDFAEAKIAAAPDPAARGAFDAEMSWIGMIMSIYGGGAGYTGTDNQSAIRSTNTNMGGGGSSWMPQNSPYSASGSGGTPITSGGVSYDQPRATPNYNPNGMGW